MSSSVNRASGVDVALPDEAQRGREEALMEAELRAQREAGKEIVVVMGLGFVGLAMAAVIADSEKDARSTKYVVGLQRASRRSYWKIQAVNEGTCPLRSEDEELGRMISRCVLEKRTLRATFVDSVLSQADVVVVDIQCDFLKEIGNVASGTVDMNALENAFRVLGERIRPDTLVLIETTVPPGQPNKSRSPS